LIFDFSYISASKEFILSVEFFGLFSNVFLKLCILFQVCQYVEFSSFVFSVCNLFICSIMVFNCTSIFIRLVFISHPAEDVCFKRRTSMLAMLCTVVNTAEQPAAAEAEAAPPAPAALASPPAGSELSQKYATAAAEPTQPAAGSSQEQECADAASSGAGRQQQKQHVDQAAAAKPGWQVKAREQSQDAKAAAAEIRCGEQAIREKIRCGEQAIKDPCALCHVLCDMCLLGHSAGVPASMIPEHTCLAVAGCPAGKQATLDLQPAQAQMSLWNSLFHAFNTPLLHVAAQSAPSVTTTLSPP
jgi:hypothetical protein